MKKHFKDMATRFVDMLVKNADLFVMPTGNMHPMNEAIFRMRTENTLMDLQITKNEVLAKAENPEAPSVIQQGPTGKTYSLN